MNPEIDKLARALNLSVYQENVLKSNPDAYKLSGLIKRGAVLYAPRVATSHVFLNFLGRIFYGRSADLIGENKMLVRRGRGIDFRAHGFMEILLHAPLFYVKRNINIALKSVVCANKIAHICCVEIHHNFRQ